MNTEPGTHYSTLGLHRRAGAAEIRIAYLALARKHHPDRNAGAAEAHERTLAINAAYEVLGDPGRKRAYDAELEAAEKAAAPKRPRGAAAKLAKDAYLSIAELLSGTTLNVSVLDPVGADAAEVHELVVPPETAPGTRFRIRRAGADLVVRIKLRPDARFKARGSDLRCDLRISTQRATQGGCESIRGPMGLPVRVLIPAHVGCGEVIRVGGGGLPKPRGGRGDLLVRIQYRPDVRITRAR